MGNNDRTVFLRGDFDHGVTKDLEAVVRQYPGITGIVLTSRGGTPFEGRGVARVILEHRLDTFVVTACYSACTIAFIAGKRRTLAPEGRLGFHQYGLEGRCQVPFADIEKQQKIDLVFFGAQGVGSEFLAKVYASPSSEIWQPSSDELIGAGVVHVVSEVPAVNRAQ